MEVSSNPPVIRMVIRGRRIERPAPPLLTFTETAALLGVTRQAVYGMIARRELKPIRRGSRWVFARRDVLRRHAVRKEVRKGWPGPSANL